jgi:3',5'-cyclic-AMP phosphodiesterase
MPRASAPDGWEHDDVHLAVSSRIVQLSPAPESRPHSKPLNNLSKSPVKLVQLTDQHLFGDTSRALRGVPTLPALRATLAAARGDIAACDAILATGDLVNDDPGGYAHFRATLSPLGKQVLCVPGNHDDVPAMRAELSDAPFQYCGLFDVGNWRVVMLDSTIRGEIKGHLSESELAHLDNALSGAPDRHALVCLHHHPVATHSRWLDTVGLTNRGEFFSVLQRHPQVRAVVFGHVHQALDVQQAGVRMLATPSTCSQFKPLSDDFAVDDQPPAWRRLQLHDDGRIDSDVAWVE